MPDNKTQNELLQIFQDEYLPKIYSFSRIKISSSHEADELAGEIILQVVKYIRRGSEIGNMNAFVWKVSNNTLCKLLRQKKHGNTVYLTELIPSGENVENEMIQKEDIKLMRRELSMLSEKYRKTVILYYFEGKTCEEIAKMIGKPSGTVKWWLHEAKKFIKEGMNTMREYGEKSYKPANLVMSCQGTPGANMEPMTCAKRKSAQNILLAAYRQPLSVEELVNELGISAPYIEDEAEYLTQQNLMKKSGDKYQTDFVILPGYKTDISDRIYETCIPGYFSDLINILESNKEKLTSAPFNPAGFTWDRLLWMYIHLFTDINLCEFKRKSCKIVMWDDIPERPNGGRWIAIGWGSDGPNEKSEIEYKEYQPWDGPVHKSEGGVQGFFHHWSGVDSSVYFDIPPGVFTLCREIITGIKEPDKLNEDDQLLFSHAIESKLFLRTDDGFQLNYCYLGKEQMNFIEKLCGGFYETAYQYFKTAYDMITEEFEKLVPKNLHWQMGNLLSNYLNPFVTCSLYEANNKNLLSKPDETNKSWLSLFATE